MPKLLLVAVNSQYIHSSPAVQALLRSAEQAKAKICCREFTINQPHDEVLAAILAEEPDIIAFSTYIWNIDFISRLVDDLHQLLPQAFFMAGGPEVSARPQHYMQQLALHAVCVGEGELCFLQLLQRLKAEPAADAGRLVQLLSGIPGLMLQGSEQSFVCTELADLGQLPFLYTQAALDKLAAEQKVIYYESSRGCPFGCTFCASAREKLRERPLPLVLKEMQLLAQTATQIKFIDRTFNANPQRALAITEQALRLFRPGLSWHFEIAPSLLTEELVQLWCSAPKNYFRLELGVQTLNPKALAAVGRREQWEKAEPNVERLIAARCHLHLDLIAGLPLDTPEQFAASFHRLHQLNAHYLQLGFLKILPGSLLAETAADFGIIYSRRVPYQVLSTPQMPMQWLLELRKAERAFNVLYNRAAFREILLPKAEGYAGGALEMYFRAAEIMARPEKQNKADVVAEL